MESRWDVKRYIGAAPAVMTNRSEALASIDRRRALNHPVYGIWAIELLRERVLVGNLLLKPIPLSVDDPLSPSEDVEIGWHLHPEYWGHGYASEAGYAGLGHAFVAALPRLPDDLRRYTPSSGGLEPGRPLPTPSPTSTPGCPTVDLPHRVTLRAGKVHTRNMVRAKSDDIGSDDSGRLFETESGEQEQDPVLSLHDIDEETGDEAGLEDSFSIDSREAKERGVELDSAGGQEPELD
jgi:hypothetical protein